VTDFLKELNDAQLVATRCTDGPSLVIAGAGSGKTRVLTYKIAYLLSQDIKPHSILALTFTNKAAKEMKERIAKLVGPELARNLWMGTFHSIFSKILRIESATLGYSSNYTIYDTSDSKSVIKAVLKELNLDEQVYKVSEALGRISMAKNNLVTPQGYLANNTIMEQDKASRKPRLADIYRLYCIRCRKSDAMDFDDLLLNTNILFRDFPDILEKYRKIFRYILVDEYQDTNFSQYLIVNKLAGTHKNITVVGDDAQSIYSFRGAKIENILNFKNDYPGCKLFKLEQNYRSTQTIVEAANSIIAKNKGQIHKKVWSSNEQGDLVKVIEAETDQEEGFIIANTILDTRLTYHLNFNQFAILYRTNAQSRIFEESLRKRNIPYKVYGSLSFYQRKEIKDLLAYFRLTLNKSDNEAFKRIINYPLRGIGNTTVDKIEEYANRNEISMWAVISENHIHNIELNRGTIKKIQSFINIIDGYSAELYEKEAYELAIQIAKSSGIMGELKSDGTYESISRMENIEELLNSIKEFSDENKVDDSMITLDRYLENVALLTDTDTEKEGDWDKVKLMTIHSAKGLEFDHVFIAGVEEDLFPSRLSVGSPQELEEERRLFYVALTRAAKKAFISYAAHRYKWGVPTICSPSRFIKDIDLRYLDYPASSLTNNDDADFLNKTFGKIKDPAHDSKQGKLKSYDSSLPFNLNKKLVEIKSAKLIQTKLNDSVSDDPSKIKSGMTVYHQQFGIGRVIAIEGMAPNTKAAVLFDNSGEKKLLLKFARLKIVE